jgi:hypothetical protein
MVACQHVHVNTHVKESIKEVRAPGIPYRIIDELPTIYHITQMDQGGDIVLLNIWKEDVVVELEEKVIDLCVVASSPEVSIVQ